MFNQAHRARSFRLVTWNCNMGFHRKVRNLMALEPDVLVLPECAAPEVLRVKAPEFSYSACEWSGINKDKGLGVFAFNGLGLRRHESWTSELQHFLPLEVRGDVSVNLLAVWAFGKGAKGATVTPNPRTTLQALEHYTPFLQASTAIVAGDFNGSPFFNTLGTYSLFAAVDAKLRTLGLVSAYHAHTGVRLGEEAAGTLFWLRNRGKPYHIDYAYVPEASLPDLQSVALGTPDDWLALSDHMPLTVELRAPAAR
jgi:exonuclease III